VHACIIIITAMMTMTRMAASVLIAGCGPPIGEWLADTWLLVVVVLMAAAIHRSRLHALLELHVAQDGRERATRAKADFLANINHGVLSFALALCEQTMNGMPLTPPALTRTHRASHTDARDHRDEP